MHEASVGSNNQAGMLDEGCRLVQRQLSAGIDDMRTGSGSNPFTGSWRPEQPLSTFVNEPVNGDWQLEVDDAFSIESGTLQAVTLNFELRCPDR